MWPFKKKVEQHTWCFCPACKVDLCSNDSLIYDGNEFSNEVVYKCKERGCGNVSWWNFDIAPFPVLVKSDEGSTDLKIYEID
jgi:hypothetical protein